MLWLAIVAALLLSALSLRGAQSRRRYLASALRQMESAPCPPATVIVPVKGPEEGLAENLSALAALDYPDYELIVVARAPSDLPPDVVPKSAKVVFAGEPPPKTSEKIGNLLAAVRQARPQSQLYAFADSDGRPAARWLRALAAAVHADGVGAATGYRWHAPQPADFASLLRSVWNSVIAEAMFSSHARFCWGGATAIRRSLFEQLDIPRWWLGAVSDDYRLSEAVRRAGLRIAFAPGALVAATDHCSLWELLAWTRRQMLITRFYAPWLWRLALAAHLIYCAAMAAAAALTVAGSLVAAAALTAQIALGLCKAAQRLTLIQTCLPEYAGWFGRYRRPHLALTPVGTWLWLFSCLASAFSRNLHWRGRLYRLRRLDPWPCA